MVFVETFLYQELSSPRERNSYQKLQADSCAKECQLNRDKPSEEKRQL